MHAQRGERRRHNLAGENFAEGGDVVGGARSQFAHGRDAAQQFIQSFKVSAQVAVKLGEQRRPQQFSGSVVVAFVQAAAEFQRGLAIAGPGGAGHGQQLVGHLGHGADHDHRLLRQPAFDDGAGALDGLGVLHRGAAELHDDHRGKFLGEAKAGEFLRA